MAFTLIVNGVKMPTPKKDGYKVEKNKVWSSNSGRTANGTMVGDLIGIKYKLELQWSLVKQSDVEKIDNAVSGTAFFDVTFYDPTTGTNKTKTFYAGDPSYPVYSSVLQGKPCQNVSVNLIEK